MGTGRASMLADKATKVYTMSRVGIDKRRAVGIVRTDVPSTGKSSNSSSSSNAAVDFCAVACSGFGSLVAADLSAGLSDGAAMLVSEFIIN